MKKHIMKVKKQFADQTFLRGDKGESTHDDLDVAQKRVETIKHSFQNVHKKISGCLQAPGQDTIEKRKKKMPAFSVASTLEESAVNFNDVTYRPASVFGSVLQECGSVQKQLGEELMAFEMEVEKNILSPLTNLLENDIPSVMKLKKHLSKLCQDMESAKSKYETAFRHTQQMVVPTAGPAIGKTTALKDEYDELTMKVDLQKDALAGETFALVSRETEFSHLILQWYTLQADYHSRVAANLETQIPRIRALISDSSQRPAFGCPLEEHLRVTNRQISMVIETCVCALLDIAMDEEGLFRIAGSATKVKRLKCAFDAGFLTMPDYVMDPHAIAGALKSYLRELPEPLMTYALYDDWMKANCVADKDARLQSLWQVVKRLPEQNHNNLRYLIRFLARLSTNCEKNKMSPQNIAIVIAPNLIWAPNQENNLHIGMNMSVANNHSAIVDSLIMFADWFFPGEIDYYISTLPLPPLSSPDVGSDMGIVNSGFEATNGEAETEASILNSLNTSPTSHSPRVVHKPGKKQAPPAPGQRTSSIKHPSQQHPMLEPAERNSFERSQSVNNRQDNQATTQDRITPPVMTRSATLDRPGKPKRNTLIQRQSHDNLTELVGNGKPEISNYERAAAAIRNRSLERPPKMEKPIALTAKPTEALSCNSESLKAKKVYVRGSSGDKPLIPAKPPSIDNLIGSLNAELAQHIFQKHNDSPDLERSLSDKDSIQFVDDSDTDDFLQRDARLSSSDTPFSETSLDDSNPFTFESDVVENLLYEAPNPTKDTGNQSTIASPAEQITVVAPISNFDKKWDFLTGGQGTARPPERPPRTFPLPGNPTAQQLKTEDSGFGGSSSERSSPVNHQDSSVRSTRSASPTAYGSPLDEPSPKQNEIESVSLVVPVPVNGKVPPSPTGSVKTTRPPRPQPPPPPPPVKPKPNHSSEDTRL